MCSCPTTIASYPVSLAPMPNCDFYVLMCEMYMYTCLICVNKVILVCWGLVFKFTINCMLVSHLPPTCILGQWRSLGQKVTFCLLIRKTILAVLNTILYRNVLIDTPYNNNTIFSSYHHSNMFFFSPLLTHGGSMDSRHGFATQTSLYKDKPILGCHFGIALMHKYHFLKSRQTGTNSHS